MQQNATECNFNSSASWVILSPIEQRIKEKIETVGTPLKDWNINIYRGVLTGCNEAFVITGEKRQKILDNCLDSEERERTDALIRPILRGKDIKRYGYRWDNWWLITTHNGIKDQKIPRIQVEYYPAIKAHLDSYWNKIERRADQGDTPYNLRNCAYMEDFLKPKIIFQEMVQESSFSYDEHGHYFCLDTGRIITGDYLKYLIAIFNSKLFFFAIKYFYGGGSLGEAGVRMKHTFFERFPCIMPDEKSVISIETLVDEIIENDKLKYNEEINHIIYKLYGLSQEEISCVELF